MFPRNRLSHVIPHAIKLWRMKDSSGDNERMKHVVAAVKPGLKHAMDLNGYYGGPPRLPSFHPLLKKKPNSKKCLTASAVDIPSSLCEFSGNVRMMRLSAAYCHFY
jgi:hypothetical protein